MADKNKFSLATVKNKLGIGSKDFLDSLQKDALKDFIKGAYRLSLEKEREMEKLQKEVVQIKKAIDSASQGKWEELSAIKIPARFFDEGTLRKHGKSLISGSDEIRFLDSTFQRKKNNNLKIERR